MTKEEWNQAEKALQHFFTPVLLKADGYDVTLMLERVGVYSNKIMVYIGGKFKGQWLTTDCEERRRFMQKRSKSLVSSYKMKSLCRGLSKQGKEELRQRNKYETYSPQWSSFKSLKNHLLKHNQDIQLIQIG